MTFIPCSSASFKAPVNEPSPPMTMSASMSLSRRFFAAFERPSGVLNSWERALFRNVPPSARICFTLEDESSIMSFSIMPSYPRKTPKTLLPWYKAVLTTARIAAFIPGASPPEVRTAMLLISVDISAKVITKCKCYTY